MAWMIVGDTEIYNGCLIRMCYCSKDEAEQELHRMVNNPTKEDLYCTKGHTNIRLEKANAGRRWD